MVVNIVSQVKQQQQQQPQAIHIYAHKSTTRPALNLKIQGYDAIIKAPQLHVVIPENTMKSTKVQTLGADMQVSAHAQF